MEKPCSYYDWEKSFEKSPEKKKKEPKKIRIINSIGLPHDFFKSYLKLWKSHNLEDRSRFYLSFFEPLNKVEISGLVYNFLYLEKKHKPN